MRPCPALRALAAAPMTHMPSTPSPHPHHPFHLYSSAFPLRDPFHADLFSSAASFHQRLQLPPNPHTYHEINARKRRSRSSCRLPLSIPSSAHQPFAKKKGSSISLKLDHPILALHCFPSQSPPLHSVTSFQDFIPTKKDGRTRLRPPPLHCSGLFFALRMSITASTGVLVPPTNGLFSAVRAVTHARGLTCLPPVQPPVGCSSDVTQHSKASA